MILKRLFPTRWARIAAWTAAALAWGTSVVTFAANAGVTAEPALPPVPETTTTTSTTTTTPAPIPNQPERGLVVLRYTPVPLPPPQVIVRKVVVAGSSGGGGSGGGGASTGVAKAAPAAKTVKSSGS